MPLPSPDNASPKDATPYALLGGETAVRHLVKRFYALMDTRPQAQGIRRLHPADLAGSEDKLFMFLSGWLGGPPLFVEKYGHPMLRRRHLPFAISTDEASQWMSCMRQALAETTTNATLRAQLDVALTELALHMRNRQDQDAPAA
ncbi:group II truncated hemoglobin [Rugosibacter aromaticivorans]|uniref:group II truncated hemoglobin n=1 Tax=Rugosibacter aromaticivorans TaxID=1565605 RepID=UPI000AD1332F|nr:group II truncated hemoglobin [Rugosibacter aromaticivorans]TBR12884.1 MAG: globin [Rugosibacter sp.]